MNLRWESGCWSCDIALPTWASMLDPRAGGLVSVAFNPEGSDENLRPTPEQLKTLDHISEIQGELRIRVEGALKAHYEEVRPRYLALATTHPRFFADFSAQMPDAPSPEVFAALHKLDGIFIHPVIAGELAYVGFGFRAAWEVEHGVGVLVHDGRIVEVGNADTALLQWIAEKDLEGATRGKDAG